MNRKVIVVYFSRTGYTKRVAEPLATALDATLCPITEPKSRLGLLGYSRCLWEASMGATRPSIRWHAIRAKPISC